MFITFAGKNQRRDAMIELTLTRHGETLENQQHILQGQLPGTLSPLGIEQARKLAEKLKNERVDAVVCSDLARSWETAEVIASFHELEPEATPLLREMDWGVYTGQQLDDVNWSDLPDSVESVDELFNRAAAFIRYLKTYHEGKRIVAVGHGAFNRAIATYLQGKKAMEMTELPIMENTACILFQIL